MNTLFHGYCRPKYYISTHSISKIYFGFNPKNKVTVLIPLYANAHNKR